MPTHTMLWIQIVISLVGGGLAGGFVSTWFNRRFYLRKLRTDFYPVVNDAYAAYFLRIEEPHGDVWVQTVGDVPSASDRFFVGQRSQFVVGLFRFNELEEARELRKAFAPHPNTLGAPDGTIITVDLKPELDAIGECLKKTQKKLQLE